MRKWSGRLLTAATKMSLDLYKKIPNAMGDHHVSGVDSYIITSPVQGDVSPDVSSYTKLKNFVQECMDVAGVEDASKVLSAFKSIGNIKIRLGIFLS
jgi:hypothetical protein